MSLKSGKKKWIIAIVAVVLVVAVGIVAVASNSKNAQAVTTQGTVSYVEKRTIANSISGNGTVESASKEDVVGGSYGMEVKSVHVEEGDVVAVGDIICVFDTEDLEERRADLREQAIEAEEEKAKQNAEYDQEIADAESNRQEQLVTANANLEEAKATYEEEQAELTEMKAAKQALLDAGKTIADEDVRELTNSINYQNTTVNNAKNRVDTYEQQVESLENQDNSSLIDAKENYNEQFGESSQSRNEQAEEYDKQIEEATIRANMAGIVTSVNVSAGSNFTGGAVASIESLDAFIIEAQIEEYDIPDIEVGMKVLVKTDATRDAELEGVVTYVAPRATNSGSSSKGGFSSLMSGMDTSSFSSSSGSATYLVKIALNEPNERLRLGMNAKVSIITEERVDTWSVPYDAVYTREDGTTYLERVTGKDAEGNILTEEMNVELGIQGTYYVEVLSSEITSDTQILIPDAQGNSSIEELLNMMGADAGI